MKLKLTGHDRRNVQYVSVDVLKKVSNGNTMGHFYSDIQWNDKDDPIWVAIENTIYINNTLQGKEKDAVLVHENQHFVDFQRLLLKMKQDIDAVLKANKDPQLEARIEWLIYDRCQTSAAFHRKAAGYSVEICWQPSSQRPK